MRPLLELHAVGYIFTDFLCTFLVQIVYTSYFFGLISHSAVLMVQRHFNEINAFAPVAIADLFFYILTRSKNRSTTRGDKYV